MEVRIHPISGYVFTEDGEVYNPKNGYKLNPYVDRCGYCKIGVYAALVVMYTEECMRHLLERLRVVCK